MIFMVELAVEFLERLEKIKKLQMEETSERIELLKQAIDLKFDVIQQAIESLHYVHFEKERGLVLDQLPMMVYNSIIDEGASQYSERPKSVLTLSNNQMQRMIKEDRGKSSEERELLSQQKGRSRRDIEAFEKRKVGERGGK